MAVGGVEQLLLRAELGDVIGQKLLGVFLRLVDGIDLRRPLFQIDLVAFRTRNLRS